MRTPLTASVALSILLFVAGCTCNRLLIHEKVGRRPVRPHTIEGYLREKRNRPIKGFSQAIGFFTTSFKNLGVFGWIDLNLKAEVIGCVEQEAISTDHLQTLDVRVVSFRLAGEEIRPPELRFIRTEVCRAGLPSPPPVHMPREQQVRISGKLMWDGDGFFEIHPGLCGKVVILDSPCPPS